MCEEADSKRSSPPKVTSDILRRSLARSLSVVQLLLDLELLQSIFARQSRSAVISAQLLLHRLLIERAHAGHKIVVLPMVPCSAKGAVPANNVHADGHAGPVLRADDGGVGQAERVEPVVLSRSVPFTRGCRSLICAFLGMASPIMLLLIMMKGSVEDLNARAVAHMHPPPPTRIHPPAAPPTHVSFIDDELLSSPQTMYIPHRRTAAAVQSTVRVVRSCRVRTYGDPFRIPRRASLPHQSRRQGPHGRLTPRRRRLHRRAQATATTTTFAIRAVV